MNVNEMIKELQHIKNLGFGEVEVNINSHEYTVQEIKINEENEDYPVNVEIIV